MLIFYINNFEATIRKSTIMIDTTISLEHKFTYHDIW